jgi:hypothetical protein
MVDNDSKIFLGCIGKTDFLKQQLDQEKKKEGIEPQGA